ncbi:hypothetical protein [Alteraurantiacibacter buctensis]|uniref:Uncharacterized protein n=1 Tax=Alteraurantiacibacter buctensis TaxID=1503981 RepID=A0A844Z3E4_9SPHN|nr:hypothetical protein [Alteraurantiacibacter buctensis]MXO73067.1 hypothetical protein [Alteraurantiacibacter buctensis]
MDGEMRLRGKLQFAQFMQLMIITPIALIGVPVAGFLANDWTFASFALLLYFGSLWTLSREIGQRVSLNNNSLIYRPPGFSFFGNFGWREETEFAFNNISDARLFRVNANNLKRHLGIVDEMLVSCGGRNILIVKDAMHKDDFDFLCRLMAEKCPGLFDPTLVIERKNCAV